MSSFSVRENKVVAVKILEFKYIEYTVEFMLHNLNYIAPYRFTGSRTRRLYWKFLQ